MSEIVQAKCPNCRNVLRIPAEWVEKPMRCKHCQQSFQARSKAAPVASAHVAPAATARALAQPPAVAVQAPHPPRPKPRGNELAFDDEPFLDPKDSPSPVRKPTRGGGKGLLLVAFAFLGIAGIAALGAVAYFTKDADPSPNGPALVEAKKDNDKKDGDKKDDTKEAKKDGDSTEPPEDIKPKSNPKTNPKTTPKTNPKDNPKTPPIVKTGAFPRRALLISVNSYLMYNSLHFGSKRDPSGRYPGSSTRVLLDQLTRPPMNILSTQVFELSDSSDAFKTHPTQKSVIETTIHDFLATSREQDRVMILFTGHAVEIDKEAYLIPIDGRRGKAETLVPLKWVYDEMAKCKARQKVLVLDVFRFSPSRGFELPAAGEGAEGAMPEAFDAALLAPPPGVQVWSSCVKEQSSTELDGGSAFLQAFCRALQDPAGMTGISDGSSELPLDSLVTRVNKRLAEILAPEKRTQTSRLTGTKPAGGPNYDPAEPSPEVVKLKPPTLPGGEAAGNAMVDKMLAEIAMLPPVRDSRKAEKDLLRADNLPPFPAKTLDFYKADGYDSIVRLREQYKKDNDGFAKKHPVRAAVFEAVDALEQSNKVNIREYLAGPINPKQKTAFLMEQQEPGIQIFEMKKALSQMKAVADERAKETSKRWQANFDYTMARLESRLVYLFEYSYILGQIRSDSLPELAAGQSGWRVGSNAKITVPEPEAKAMAKEISKLWKKVQDDYPDTPWALLAERESMMALGLQWRGKSD